MTESIEDFKKRYKDTYVFLNFNKKDYLVQFREVLQNEDEHLLKFYSDQTGEIIINHDTANEKLKFKFPEHGLYNVNGNAVFFSRYPARQWKRAPCKENCSLKSLLSSFLNQPISLNWKSLNQIFNPKYPKSLDEAIKNMDTSISLSLKFGISVSNRDNDSEYILWYKTSPIGYINSKTRTISVKTQSFFPEVLDLCKYKESTWNPILAV